MPPSPGCSSTRWSWRTFEPPSTTSWRWGWSPGRIRAPDSAGSAPVHHGRARDLVVEALPARVPEAPQDVDQRVEAADLRHGREDLEPDEAEHRLPPRRQTLGVHRPDPDPRGHLAERRSAELDHRNDVERGDDELEHGELERGAEHVRGEGGRVGRGVARFRRRPDLVEVHAELVGEVTDQREPDGEHDQADQDAVDDLRAQATPRVGDRDAVGRGLDLRPEGGPRVAPVRLLRVRLLRGRLLPVLLLAVWLLAVWLLAVLLLAPLLLRRLLRQLLRRTGRRPGDVAPRTAVPPALEAGLG